MGRLRVADSKPRAERAESMYGKGKSYFWLKVGREVFVLPEELIHQPSR